MQRKRAANTTKMLPHIITSLPLALLL